MCNQLVDVMKKYLYQFMLALFAISSLTFVACSDDDDDPINNNERNSIEINGVSYNLSAFSFMGNWNETLRKGDFTVAVDNESNGIVNVEYSHSPTTMQRVLKLAMISPKCI